MIYPNSFIAQPLRLESSSLSLLFSDESLALVHGAREDISLAGSLLAVVWRWGVALDWLWQQPTVSTF